MLTLFRTLFTASIICAVCAVPFASVGNSQTQMNSDTQQGIALYEQDRAKDAIEALRRATKLNSNDADAWHFLGLAYFKMGQNGEARKSIGKGDQITA